MAIPRILHQVYLQGWDAIPAETRQAIDAMRARNPGWEYRFYDEAAAEAWLRANAGDDVIAAYHRINPAYRPAQGDLLRYLICLRHGGVYLDIKSSGMAPLDSVLRDDDVYVLSQGPELRDLPAGPPRTDPLAHIPGGEYVQWFIACAPGHPFLQAVIQAVLRNIRDYRPLRDGVGKPAVLNVTGPVVYSNTVHALRTAHPHRLVAHERDLDFVYSIHGDFKSHRAVYGRHYSKLTSPVVRVGPVQTALGSLWFGGVRPATTWVGWKIDGARRRIRKLSGN